MIPFTFAQAALLVGSFTGFAGFFDFQQSVEPAVPFYIAAAPQELIKEPIKEPAKMAKADPATRDAATLNTAIEGVQKYYDNIKDFQASFQQKYTYAALRRTQESTGKVIYKKPGLMRWDYTNPSQKSFIIDNSRLWIYQPADKTAFVNACFQQDGLTASVAFLLGSGKIKDQFTAQWSSSVYGNATDYHIELLPKQNNSVFSKLVMVVDPKTNQVKQSIVVDSQNNTNQFVYSDIKINQKPSDSVFSFTPPSDTVVSRIPGSCTNVAVPGIK